MPTNTFAKMLARGGLAGLLLASTGLAAQDFASLDPHLNPAAGPAPRLVYGSPAGSQLGDMELKAAWGTQQGADYIAASEFTSSLTNNAPNLDYAGNFFFNTGSGTTTSVRYYAPVDLEVGVRISHFSCHFNDNHASANVTFNWFRYTTDFSGGGSTAETIDTFQTSGQPGIGFGFLNGPETMQVYDPVTDDLVNHHIAVDITGVTSFAGCLVFYTRQVAPAPGVATFGDVPTGHTFFQSVEALAASGITGGCGGGNFCPNNNVTRGQMAAFLARALGLGFPF